MKPHNGTQVTCVSLVARLDYWKDGAWYVGQLRDVPDVFSQGRTLAELRANIREAYDLMTTIRRRRTRHRWFTNRSRRLATGNPYDPTRSHRGSYASASFESSTR
jgi:predicted RNase H-like HicB family nuclease